MQVLKKGTAEVDESVQMNPSGITMAPSNSHLENGGQVQTSKRDSNYEGLLQ